MTPLASEPAHDPYTHVRAAFREVALALMDWEPPFSHEQVALDLKRYGHIASWRVYRPYDPQGEVEPFDIDKDWSERA